MIPLSPTVARWVLEVVRDVGNHADVLGPITPKIMLGKKANTIDFEKPETTELAFSTKTKSRIESTIETTEIGIEILKGCDRIGPKLSLERVKEVFPGHSRGPATVVDEGDDAEDPPPAVGLIIEAKRRSARQKLRRVGVQGVRTERAERAERAEFAESPESPTSLEPANSTTRVVPETTI